MAGKDFAVNCHAGAFEYLRSFIEETVDIARVDKTDLHRDRVQQSPQLLRRHVSARQNNLAAARSRGNSSRRSRILRFTPDFPGHAKAYRIILRIPVNLLPFLFREIDRADREQNILLFINHFSGAC